MNLIDKFSLQKHEGKYEDWPLRSDLYYCGEVIGVKVPGYVIDRQFELDDYFLIFISWDCPFEEGCEVVVLSKDKKIVGKYSFNAFYNSYNLDEVAQVSKDNYKLVFNGSDFFRLSVNYPKRCLLSRVVRVSAIKS